ncbi:MAG: hypothetical protein U1E14_08425 [Geminicoccaceae bacterium]
MAKASYMRCTSPEMRRIWQQRDVARRVAGGVSLRAAAEFEGVAEDFVKELADDPRFKAIVAAYEELDAKDDAEILAMLVRLCRSIIVRTLTDDQDSAVAAWMLYTVDQGESPFHRLADQVWEGFRRGLPSPDAAPARKPGDRPEASFLQHIATVMGRVSARLRAAVHREIAARALLAHLDGKPVPPAQVDALVAAVDPPPAPKPARAAQPPKPAAAPLPLRKLPRRVLRARDEDDGLAMALTALAPAEGERLVAPRPPRDGP